MSTAESIQALEASLKATLRALALILSHHAAVQSLAVTPYAPNAPRHLVQQLQASTRAFDETCAQIEQRLLKALAIQERDARKASGLPLPVTASSDAPPEPQPDLPFSVAFPSLPPTEAAPIELDDSFLSSATGPADLDSLFGDSALPSPVVPPLADADFLASLNLSTLPPSTSLPPTGESDLETLLNMVNASGGIGGDFSMEGMDFGAMSLPPADAGGMTGLEGGTIDSTELEELLKSLGGTG